MQMQWLDSAALDPTLTGGLALVAVDETGRRLGSVVARVEGTVASLPARHVTGDLALVEELVAHLMARLHREFGVREMRASAPSPALYRLYVERFGMRLWTEVVSYERPAGAGGACACAQRSTAAIRPYQGADQPAVAALAGGLDAFGNLARLAAAHRAHFMVAGVDGRVVGYALSYVEGDTCQFKSLVVDPALRRQGVGWDLTGDALAWFDGLGLPSALRTQGDNVAAQRLYETLGYRRVGQVRMVHKALGPAPFTTGGG